MPTFQSVAEASGGPAISPFEPPAQKHPDEERELQEFVASFRYQPPEESVDELTMRSEVPVLDAEAPLTPSHPSFDDDVPPPPEAGPHPTGREYYPPATASSDRARFLEIEASPHTAAGSASASSGTSFLGLDESPAADVPRPGEFSRPVRRRRALWSWLAILGIIFGAIGFFQGRAEMTRAYPGPVAVLRQQYAKLRQRVSALTAPAPATSTESPAAQTPEAKPAPPDQSTNKPPAESSDNPNPSASPATQSAAVPDQQPSKSSDALQQSPPAADASAASPQPATQKPTADAPPKPAPDATATKHGLASEPPLTTAKPKSKPDPGQQELANATQASDPAAAAAWLWKATSRGNPVAPVRLADMYIKGKGVPRSCEQALVLLRSEAAKDNAPARNRLAALYANGTCVPRDRVRAYQLMSSALAVDPTSEWAEQNRKELWQQMTPEERTQAEKYR